MDPLSIGILCIVGLIVLWIWATKQDQSNCRKLAAEILELLPIEEDWEVIESADQQRHPPFAGATPVELASTMKQCPLLHLKNDRVNRWLFRNLTNPRASTTIGMTPVVVMELMREKEYGIRFEQKSKFNRSAEIWDERFQCVRVANQDGKDWMIGVTDDSDEAINAAMELFERCVTSDITAVQIIYRVLTVCGKHGTGAQRYADLWECAKQVAANTDEL